MANHPDQILNDLLRSRIPAEIPEDLEKSRYKRYFDAQKPLLDTSDFSDLTVTCDQRSWWVHKAIVCSQSTWFYNALIGDRFKEGAQNRVTLQGDADEPEVIDLALRYMYTQDYSVTMAPRKPYPTPGLRVIGWSNARGLTRGERGKLQYGITYANVTAMTAAMVIVQAEHNDLQVDPALNELVLPAWRLSPPLGAQLNTLFSKPESTQGTPWHIEDDETGDLCHAKLFVVADCYDIKGLCELSLQKLFADQEGSFESKEGRDAVHFLMRHRRPNDTSMCMAVTQALVADTRRFGVRLGAWEIMEEYPVLKDYMLQELMHDNVWESNGESWEALGAPLPDR